MQRSRLAVRLALAAVPATCAGLALAGHLGFAADRDALLALAEGAGAGPLAAERLRRATDPVEARMGLARALLAQAMEAPPEASAAGTAVGTTDGTPTPLVAARALAEEAAALQPSSWEAPMVQGAATYLEWSKARDPRLFLEAAAWEKPLVRSTELAPSRTVPARFLAAAYLELWPTLSPAKKDEARERIRRGLEDPATFARLIEPWLARATSRREAFGAIPERSGAWATVADSYARSGAWSHFLAARDRFDGALGRELEAGLAEARARRAGGDVQGARELYLEVAARARPGATPWALVSRALEEAPPGAALSNYTARLEALHERALDLLTSRGACPLEPRVMARLTGLAGEVAPDRRALAALAADDLSLAERLERRAGAAAASLEWGPFQIEKARQLMRRGELDGAAQALGRVHPVWTHRLPYRLADLRLAEASGDAAAATRAAARLARFAAAEWPAAAWRSAGAGHRLEWRPEQPGGGVEVVFAVAPPRGTAVEARFDGEVLGTFPARPGARLRLERPFSAGEVHLLEVEGVADGRLMPGRVRTLPVPPAAAGEPPPPRCTPAPG